jgi:uncharacterized repeat protein (TIGR01451 family)
MSADILPSIAGTVFQSANVGVAGATVTLSENNSVLDTATTDASGNYRFDNLSPGTYSLQLTAAPGLTLSGNQGAVTVTIAASDEAGQAGTVIDSFSSSPQMVSDSFFAGRTVSVPGDMNQVIVGGVGVSSTVAAGGALGGYRTLYVQRTTPSGEISLGADANIPGALEFSSGPVSNGAYSVTWDGNGSQTLNPTGLGQIDLTGGGADTGLLLDLGADHDGGYVQVNVYSDSADWSQAIVNIPNTTDGSLGQSVFVPWTQFNASGGSGADFTQVGAVQLQVNGISAVDGQVGALSAYGPKTITENLSVPEADMAITKTAPASATAGQQLTYQLVATNNGPSGATNVTISDPLPSTLTFVSATASQGVTTNYANGTFTATVASLPNGQSATVNLTTTIAATASGTIKNVATVSADQPDPNLTNNTATATTNVTPVQPQTDPDITLKKSANLPSVTVGQNLTYTLTATNDSLTPATNATISDPLPTGVTYVSAVIPTQSQTQGTASFANNQVQAVFPTLAANASATLTIVVNVTSAAGSLITNIGSVTPYPDPNNVNTEEVQTPVTGAFGKLMFCD